MKMKIITPQNKKKLKAKIIKYNNLFNFFEKNNDIKYFEHTKKIYYKISMIQIVKKILSSYEKNFIIFINFF